MTGKIWTFDLACGRNDLDVAGLHRGDTLVGSIHPGEPGDVDCYNRVFSNGTFTLTKVNE